MCTAFPIVPSGGRPGTRWGRRRFLRAAAYTAVAAAGCARPIPAAAAQTTIGVTVPLPPAAVAPTLEAQFAADNPGFRVVYARNGAPGVQWWLVQGAPYDAGLIDLGPALQALNFQPSILPSALWSTYIRDGPVVALPTHLEPVAVAYWPDALKGAGAAEPSPDWTVADFTSTCQQIQYAIQSGALQKIGVQSVLPRMVGSGTGSIDDINMWGAFVQGFGGDIVAGQVSGLASTAGVQGVTALVNLARRFGSDPEAPLAGEAFAPSVAMSFMVMLPGALTPAWEAAEAYRYARFPALPVRPVVPAYIGGRGLAYGYDGPSGCLPVVPENILEGAARYFIWLYQTTQQQLLARAGRPPITADDALVRAFWADHGMDVQSDDFIFPDWAPYLKYMKGNPLILESAVLDPQQVPSLLAKHARAIDAALGREQARPTAAEAAAAAKVAAAKASAARAFPTAGPTEGCASVGR